jgi:hypothetical protein
MLDNLFFLCPERNGEMVLKQIASAYFSCSPTDFNPRNLITFEDRQMVFQNYALSINKSFKLLLSLALIILWSALQRFCHQKDERTKLGGSL